MDSIRQEDTHYFCNQAENQNICQRPLNALCLDLTFEQILARNKADLANLRIFYLT